MNAFGQEQVIGNDASARRVRWVAGSGGKEDLAQKAASLMRHDFIKERILPFLRLDRTSVQFDCSTTVLQNTGTGRLTLRYIFHPGTVVIGKVFTDGLGLHSFQVISRLWNSGFGHGSRYQVPAVIGFFPDINVLLMRQATGTPVASAIAPEAGLDLFEYCREAARWLAALHRSSIRFGEIEPDWQSLKLFRLSTRLIKAVAAKPEQLNMVRDLLRAVSDRVLALPPTRAFVQTHGRYHHDHVLVGAEATVVIDLDRCCPSDPSKDVAEFISVLRSTSFKRGISLTRIEAATNAFLREYYSKVPEAEGSLPAYWATAVLHDLLSGLKKRRDAPRRSWPDMEQFYLTEIKRALDIKP